MMLLRSLFAAVTLPALCVYAANGDVELTCSECHPRQAGELAGSAHLHWRCQECHGGAARYTLSASEAAEFVNRPAGAEVTFDHGKEFAQTLTRADIPALCGGCHADVERMNPFGLRTDQLARYRTSGHGRALLERGDERVAVCTDCHGAAHAVLAADNPLSLTHPLNVPDMCGACHADPALMSDSGSPVEVVSEYRDSVHGRLLLEQHDTGAPTCATCHGNHSAMPPGFASVGAVCGRCHQQVAEAFATSVHATEDEFEGCVTCHAGTEGGHFHRIERIIEPVGRLVARYDRLRAQEPRLTAEQIAGAIHPEPRRIITEALPVCTACHDDVEEDESLARMFTIIGTIEGAERRYVETATRLDRVGRGVLLVDNARFRFGDAKTLLIALAPLQHTLDEAKVAAKVGELHAVCDEVNGMLDRLEGGLELRYRLLGPFWGFAICFAVGLYMKYRKVKAVYVRPERDATASHRVDGTRPAAVTTAPGGPAQPARRTFLDWLIGVCSATVGAALGFPALLYLFPAAKGGGASRVEVEGAAGMQPDQSATIQVAGKPVIVVRQRTGFRAFSAACTHLGCLVKWDSGSRQFRCPCHAAVFDDAGAVVSGPPPAPLPVYKVKEVGDKVFVSAV